MKLFSFISSIYLINNLKQCQSKNGVQHVQLWESPCICSFLVICWYGFQCHEETHTCSLHQSNNLDHITTSGQFSFNSLYLNNMNTHSFWILSNQFVKIGTIPNGRMAISDVGNGTFWTMDYNFLHCLEFKENMCNDITIELREWADGLVLKSHLIPSVSDHELRSGHHPLEVILIKYQDQSTSNLVNEIQGLMILDFTFDPPTIKYINPIDQFNPVDDWGSLSKKIDWMHGNSAGIDNDGNYYMNGRGGSFWTVWDKDTLQPLYTISSEFRSDYKFIDDNDKMQNAHDTHQLENGHWLLYDNGNYRPEDEGGEQSRCIEYEVDHDLKTVRKIWEFKIDKFCSQAGSCRRLINGNTVILFSNCSPKGVDLNLVLAVDELDRPIEIENQILEVAADGDVLGQAKIPWDRQQVLYRAVVSDRAEDLQADYFVGQKQYSVFEIMDWVMLIVILIIIICDCFIKSQKKKNDNNEIQNDIRSDQVNLNIDE